MIYETGTHPRLGTTQSWEQARKVLLPKDKPVPAPEPLPAVQPYVLRNRDLAEIQTQGVMARNIMWGVAILFVIGAFAWQR